MLCCRTCCPSILYVICYLVTKSCLTFCDHTDCNPPGISVRGISQARILEWVAISFSNAWKWKVKVKLLSRVWLFATPWTAVYQAPPSMGFSRQEYWSGVPFAFLSPYNWCSLKNKQQKNTSRLWRVCWPTTVSENKDSVAFRIILWLLVNGPKLRC